MEHSLHQVMSHLNNKKPTATVFHHAQSSSGRESSEQQKTKQTQFSINRYTDNCFFSIQSTMTITSGQDAFCENTKTKQNGNIYIYTN